MPAYQYTAVDEQGKQQKGVLEAESAKQIRQQLREKSLLPIEVAVVEKTDAKEGNLNNLFKKRINATDLALMTRQLSVLIAAAIPLEEAIKAVAKQTEKNHVKALLLSVRSKVLEGFSLAKALESSGGFPQLYITTIAAGEKSGHLDLIMSQLADYTENRSAMQKKIQGAMVYPILLAMMSFAVVIGLMTFVVPDIVKVFSQSEQALPTVTVVVMAMSAFIQKAWWLMLIAFIVCVFGFVKFIKTESGRYAFDGLVLRVPLIRKLSRGINASRFASTLAILVRSGVPLVEALKIGAAVSTNVHIKDAVNTAAEKVTEGGNLSSQLERSSYFPPMMIQMIRSGENSGELENMLKRASDMQENEVSSLIGTILALLEPIMLVIMGIIVLVIVLAVMLPIVNMNSLAGA